MISHLGQGFDSPSVHHMFYVYGILNCLNGKMYLGKTNNLKRRWTDHKRTARNGKNKNRSFNAIHTAIIKYGIDNFEYFQIQSFDDESTAYLAEIYWIDFYKTRDNEYGYNISPGGIGVGSGTNSANYGLKRSHETLLKLSKSHTGDKNQNYGKIFSDETKLKMSQNNGMKKIE